MASNAISAAWTQRAAGLRAPSTDMGEPRWMDVDGIRTRYFDQGTGEPVALFHGGNTGSWSDVCDCTGWDLTLPPLATQVNAIAVDRLGQGFTDNAKSDADYTMHASVQHAAAFLRKLGKAPYHLVGHSRGGYLVCRIALEYPELAKTCVIISSGTLSPGLLRNPVWLGKPPLPAKTRESMRWLFQRYSHHPRVVTEAWLDECMKVAETEREQVATRKMVDGLLASLYMPELRRQRVETQRWILERGMPCPTLVVWGLNDKTADFENGKLLVEMLMRKQPDTELRLLNRAGHFVYREQPEAFNGMLLDYVKSRS